MTAQRRAHLAGLLVIVVGWIAAAVVYVAAQHRSDFADPGISASEQHELERLGGRAGARTVEFDDWLASLWHGERLAYTLAGLALAIGGACFYIGGLMGEVVDEEASGTRRR